MTHELAPLWLAYGRSSESPPGPNAILLSRVQSLTLRANRLTSSRRVSPIPQLKCVGPSKTICDKYKIETMRCTNAGYDYDEEDVQWTCTAQLPEEFMLGATDVICEGYRNADDNAGRADLAEYKRMICGPSRLRQKDGAAGWTL
ncbi:hypothetical protein KXX14_003662 [Aspergillus fumigatus]|nr:hypothetical protein KXX14_003662 [Aspergillus fumigatus]